MPVIPARRKNTNRRTAVQVVLDIKRDTVSKTTKAKAWVPEATPPKKRETDCKGSKAWGPEPGTSGSHLQFQLLEGLRSRGSRFKASLGK
jgi:hypothetical protein